MTSKPSNVVFSAQVS